MIAKRLCHLLVMVMLAPSLAHAADYNVIDLGYLPNFNSNLSPSGSQGVGIDNAGEATGRSDVNVFNSTIPHGFYWSSGTLSDMDAPNSFANTFVHGMSSNGVVVGETGTGSAFTWIKASGFTYLPVPNQKNISRAFDMNAAGDVVGDSSLVNGASTAGTVWKSTGGNILLTPFNSATYFLSSAHAINSSRTIAGDGFNNLDQIATVWSYGLASGQWTAQSIGTLGGADSTAYDINNAGIVVGQASRALGHGIGAFLWHPGDAAPTDLDPTQAFGGANTFARGINSFNAVVGIIGGGGAFVWDQAHGIRDLQTLIDPLTSWSLTDAEHINNSGWIIGTAINSNDSLEHAVILRPAFVLGDFNLNGLLDPGDIQAGLNALTDLHAYQTAHNLSNADLRAIGDINGDYNLVTSAGGVNNLDLQPLLDLIAASGSGSSSGVQTVPEPASLMIFLLGVAAIFGGNRCRARLATRS